MDLWLYHDSRNCMYRSLFGAVPARTALTLRLDVTGVGDDALVKLRFWKDGNGEQILAMTDRGGYYDITVTMPDEGCLIWYYFIVQDGECCHYYGNNADQLGGAGQIYDNEPPSFQITVYDTDAVTPDWFKHAVVYQIYPDRFFRASSPTVDLQGKQGAVIHSCWDDLPCYCKDPATGDVVQYDFFGGNLAGIREKLAYLKDLGITAIYLNPIFKSRSNHRYDTGDYHSIDPFLGSNEEFASLCACARQEGIRIILDGVFSHTGEDSLYFNKFGTYQSVGAYQSQDSPYYEWYRFEEYPDEYDSWWGVKALPNVEETTPSYMDFIINNKDSVLKYWLGQGISGWRLDVVDELPPAFLRQFYKVLKQEDSDAILIGEVWEDASNKVSYSQPREYLCGHNMDSAMNYMLRTIMVDFIMGRKDGSRTGCELMHQMENYPLENLYAMLNLVGSHDVERIWTVLATDPSLTAAAREPAALGRLMLLTAWQMTMPGAPCVYYGDEAGLTGGKDPDNRRTYPWGAENKKLQAYYRQMIHMRRTTAALQTGRFILLHADGDVLAYARVIEGGRDVFGKAAADGLYIIILNRSVTDTQTITIATDGLAYGGLVDIMHPDSPALQTVNGAFTATVPALGVMVLQGQAADRPKRAGVLLHPTSLPSKYGMGDLGEQAYHFVDFLVAAGQSVWQILPLSPTGLGDSPYQSPSAFAGNPNLISLEKLLEWGWLKRDVLRRHRQLHSSDVPYTDVWQWKRDCLWEMATDPEFVITWKPYEQFCASQSYWLQDYALYSAIKEFFHDRPWNEWPEDIRERQPEAVEYYRRELSATVFFYSFLQYIFYKQWGDLKTYAGDHHISILGDVPIFVAYDSADCWAHQELFDLDECGQPKSVSGVPPDYFCQDGQLWGNPLYCWDILAQEGYKWWLERFKTVSTLVDEVRIDHFRGFESFWAVPYGAATAREGTWEPGPGDDFFDVLHKELPDLRLVAEDLGIITDAVCRLKEQHHLPGMKVLHFHTKVRQDGRCDMDTEPHCLAYTGTHDNNTTLGWYEDELSDVQRRQIRTMAGVDSHASHEDIVKALIAYLYSRRAETVIVPMQDLLCLPGSCRMNRPGTVKGNWHWQMLPGAMQFKLARWLSRLCVEYSR